jgi:succinate dehydrogenase / fumarate reductase cytochrome b subunit
VTEAPVKEAPNSTFLARNEFLLRRLHSLSGIIPVGAYMVVHLLTNATINDSPLTFQKNVYAIHSLPLLPVIEWVFIFLPLLFHGIFGVVIIRGSLPNNGTYKYTANYRYTLQRVTGMIALVFILWHVFHMHGWIHAEWWTEGVAAPLFGGQFRPYNAGSTAAMALQPLIVKLLYAIGVLSCVFHLANGIWTFGITWGIWVTPAAQRWATTLCVVFGLGLSVVGMSALLGFSKTPEQIEQMRAEENMMYEAKTASGDVPKGERSEHKRWYPPKTHANAASEPAAPAGDGENK